MDVVEVERRLEVRLAGAREEVETAVESEDRVGLLDDRRDRGHHDDIVVTFAAGNAPQELNGILHRRVDIVEFDAAGCGEFHRVQACGAVQAGLVDVRHDEERRMPVLTIQHIIDHRQSHGADARKQRQAAAVLDLHRVYVGSGRGVVAGVHGADDAAQGLAQRSGIEAFALEGEQATHLHHLRGNDDIGRVPADVLVGVAGSGKHADRGIRIVEGRLDGELVAGLELVCPFGADFDDLAGEFVTDDGRVLGDVVRDPLVGGSLVGGFVRGHADAVAHHFREDLILFDLRQLELLEPQVANAVKAYRFGLHIDYFNITCPPVTGIACPVSPVWSMA